MVWIGTALIVVTGAVALMAVVFGKRTVSASQLGSVSDRWIAEHRVD